MLSVTKRLFVLLLTCFLLLSMVTAAQAEINDIYQIENGTIIKYSGQGGNIIVPSSINGQAVTGIGPYLFSNSATLTSIVLPEGITFIAQNAFFNCHKLKSASLPNSLRTIDENAFAFCTELADISLPDGLTKISDNAFKQCKGLRTIDIPQSVNSIGKEAFRGCSYLTEINLPDGVTHIANFTFSGLAIDEVRLPSALQDIEPFAFANNIALSSFTISDSNANFSCVDGVLYNKDRTTLISYPNARNGKFTIPDSVNKIGNAAFAYGHKLKELIIPNTVQILGESLFKYNLTIEKVILPEHLTTVPKDTFKNCISLQTVPLPDGIHTIGQSAFDNCTQFENLILPKSLITIDKGAFADCSHMTEVVLPNGLQKINEQAFYGCTALESIEIPATVNYIGEQAFSRCWVMQSINVSAQSPYFKSIDGVLIDPNHNLLVRYPAGREGDYTVPEGLDIAPYAFWGSHKLTKVVMKSGQIIEHSAFENCSNLSSVVLPQTIKKINYYAFYQCSRLTEIELPEGLISLGNGCFSYSSLPYLFIPDSVTSFTGSPGVPFIVCKQEAPAYSYCLENNISVELLGDTDGSKTIDSLDALMVLQYVANISTLTDRQAAAANVSRSALISSVDAMLILQYSVGIDVS